MKQNNLLSEYLKRVPRHIDIEVDLSFAIADRIHAMLETKGISQKEFAKMMNKKESEVSRWLKGTHNFTLKTLAKITAVLDEELIRIPKTPKATINYCALLDISYSVDDSASKQSGLFNRLSAGYRTLPSVKNPFNKTMKHGKEIC